MGGLDPFKIKAIVRDIIINRMPPAKLPTSPEGQRALILAMLADKKFSEGNIEDAISFMITALKLGLPEPLNSRIKRFLLNAIDLNIYNITSERYASKFGERPDIVEINQSQTTQELKDISKPTSDSTQPEIKPEKEPKDSSQINLNLEKKTESISEESQPQKPGEQQKPKEDSLKLTPTEINQEKEQKDLSQIDLKSAEKPEPITEEQKIQEPQDLKEIPKSDLNPKEINDWFELGVECAEMGNFKRAAASFEKVVELNPKDYEAWFNKGLALEALERYNEAVQSYEEALRLKPDFEEAKKARDFIINKI